MSNTVKEQNVRSALTDAIKDYTEAYDHMKTETSQLSGRTEQFPKKFSRQVAFDDAILLASELKRSANNLAEKTISSYEVIKSDLAYFNGQFEIYIADQELKNLGFDKVTDSLRSSYINSEKELTDLKKLVGQFKSLSASAERLFRSFVDDETNCRKLLEHQTKLLSGM